MALHQHGIFLGSDDVPSAHFQSYLLPNDRKHLGGGHHLLHDFHYDDHFCVRVVHPSLLKRGEHYKQVDFPFRIYRTADDPFAGCFPFRLRQRTEGMQLDEGERFEGLPLYQLDWPL